jgi:hypothetical protein
MLSMAYVPHESKIFWVHSVFAALITIYFYYEMYLIWKVYINLRQEYFKSPQFANEHFRTLLLTDVTEPSKDAIKNFMKPSDPTTIYIGRDVGELYDLVTEHENITIKLENVLVKYLKDPLKLPEKRPTHNIYFLFGEVDSITYYGEKLDKLISSISEIRSQSIGNLKPNWSSFVTFPTVSKTNAALAIKSARAPFSFYRTRPFAKTTKCPSFDDIIWENISMKAKVRRNKSRLSTIITIGLIFGWMIVISFILGLDSNSWRHTDPRIAAFIDRHPISALLVQAVSPLLIVILNFLLPFVLVYLRKLEGTISTSQAEISALTRYFYFMILQFIVYIGLTFVVEYLKILFGKTKLVFQGRDPLLGDGKLTVGGLSIDIWDTDKV